MEAEKQADEDIARLQKEVKIFRIMKYLDRFYDGAQGKPPWFPFGAESLCTNQGTVESWPPMFLQCMTPPP